MSIEKKLAKIDTLKHYNLNLLEQNIRRYFVKKNFIEQSNKESRENGININNLCISGSWGSGKSTFIENWSDLAKHRNSKKMIIIKINIWEHDLYNNPFVSILKVILNTLWREKVIKKRVIKRIMRFVFKEIDWNLSFNPFSSWILKIATLGFGASIKPEGKSKEYMKTGKYIDSLITHLNNILSKTEKEIIIIFDEMDRLQHNRIYFFLNLMHNFFLKIKGAFFIILLDLDYIDSILVDAKKEKSKYSKKIFSLSIDIKKIIIKDIQSNYLDSIPNIQYIKKNKRIGKDEITYRDYDIAENKFKDFYKKNWDIYFKKMINENCQESKERKKKKDFFDSLIYSIFVLKEKFPKLFIKILKNFDNKKIDNFVLNLINNTINESELTNLTRKNEKIEHNFFIHNSLVNSNSIFDFFTLMPFLKEEFLEKKLEYKFCKKDNNTFIWNLFDFKEDFYPIIYDCIESFNNGFFEIKEIEFILFLINSF